MKLNRTSPDYFFKPQSQRIINKSNLRNADYENFHRSLSMHPPTTRLKSPPVISERRSERKQKPFSFDMHPGWIDGG